MTAQSLHRLRDFRCKESTLMQPVSVTEANGCFSVAFKMAKLTEAKMFFTCLRNIKCVNIKKQKQENKPSFFQTRGSLVASGFTHNTRLYKHGILPGFFQ